MKQIEAHIGIFSKCQDMFSRTSLFCKIEVFWDITPCQVILIVVPNDSGAFETSVTVHNLPRGMTENDLHLQQRRYENLNCLIAYSNLLLL
jgi:hypothetical protein